MAHTVSKTSAGFGGTGAISFSQLRKKLKRKSSGTIKASELFRITNTDLKTPIVPDCKENEDAGVPATIEECNDNEDIDWRASQMRAVITRYKIETTGTYTDLVGTSLTWNYNLTRNIPKKYEINGPIKSSLYDRPALTFKRGASNPIVNLLIYFGPGGSVLGSGGPGGGTWEQDYGADGGPALNFDSPNGKNNKIYLYNGNTLLIGGGGGGGGKGGDGENGWWGVCYKPRIKTISSKYTGNINSSTGAPTEDYSPGPWGEWYTYKIGGSCQCDDKGWRRAVRSCPDPEDHKDAKYVDIVGKNNVTTRYFTKGYRGNTGQSDTGTYDSNKTYGRCAKHWSGLWWKGTCLQGAFCAVTDPELKPGAPGGVGGNGGSGEGVNNSNINGVNGTAGTPANCPTYATRGENGRKGGDGGTWGEPGQEGEASWLGENNWETNPGGLAWRLFKFNDYNEEWVPYINDLNGNETSSLRHDENIWDRVCQRYENGECKEGIKNYWGWTSFLKQYAIYKSPIPSGTNPDPHVDKWHEAPFGIDLVPGRYKLQIEADGIGKIVIQNDSYPKTMIQDKFGNFIGKEVSVGRNVAMNSSIGIAQEDIEFYIDDWLGKFYKENNIGGSGGSLDSLARWYWEEQARIAQDSGLSVQASRDKTKETIEGTAKLPEENSWNRTDIQGDGVGTVAFNMGLDGRCTIRPGVRNNSVLEGQGFAGGRPGAAIYGTGYFVEGRNSKNLKGDWAVSD